MKLEEAKKILEYHKKVIIVSDCDNGLNRVSEAIETVLQALEELEQKEKSRIIGNINTIKIEDLEPILKPYYISKDKVKEKIEETDLKINKLKTEISKTLKENEEAGTETEIDINEQYICNMEIELEKLEIAQKVLEKLLEDK
jgi:hypothetical protein